MDVVLLSRLQFAVATLFHFLFVPLTLGLSVLVAIMETIYVRTGDEDYKRMAKFWGKIFLVNFVVGIVTGLTLEFQFGTNWAGYSKYVGDIFGSLLAIEATVAFFLESTFLAVWLFGWNKLSPKLHATSIWIVAVASSISAYWILAANSWMQHPVGYIIRGSRAELTNFFAVATQKFAIFTYLHTTFGGYIVGGFLVMGVSCYHLLKNNQRSFFMKSFGLALIFSTVFAISQVWIGDLNGKEVANKQPEKVAAIESQWETMKAAPFSILTFPDEKNERNYFEALQVPKGLSFLLYNDWNATVKGLKAWPKKDRPSVTLVFSSFRIMVGLGFIFAGLVILGWIFRNKLESKRWYMWIMVFAIPFPYLACELGWVVTEAGRQPWIVYNMMRTSNAASPIAAWQVGVSLAGFIILYSLLGLAAFILMAQIAVKGPPAVSLPQEETEEWRAGNA
jgi:cytochrome bd ubiquinol oxidase subunit I